MDTYIPSTIGEPCVQVGDVLRSIAKEVRRVPGSKGRELTPAVKAERLANKIEALAMAVDLASQGVPDMKRQARAKVRELMAS